MPALTKPATLTLPDGTTYRVTVLEVLESDGRGPRVFRRVHEDEAVKVKDQMQFWVVYANADVLDERPN